MDLRIGPWSRCTPLRSGIEGARAGAKAPAYHKRNREASGALVDAEV